ncbi:Heat shock protein 70kD [Entamoeba marina]
MKRTKECIGIDLGMNSCLCAYFDFAVQKPYMIVFDRKLKMASWINMYGLKTKDKSCWIGNGAKDSEFREYALYDSKRIIGREPQEVEDKKSWPFKVNKKGNSLVMVTENPLNGEKIKLLPEQVTAIILKKIFSIAKRTIRTHTGNVVITVPAQFNDRQREATLKAAKIARINVTSLINEPVAALLAYKHRFPDDFANVKYSVVFDFGSGSLDVAVCKNEDDDRIDVVNCGGDQNLGGNNFDLVLINIIKERILEMYPEGAKYFEKQNGDTGKDERQRKQVLGRVKKSSRKS